VKHHPPAFDAAGAAGCSRALILKGCAAFTSLLHVSAACAQPPTPPLPIDSATTSSTVAPAADGEPWRVELTAYLWALGLSGDVGVRNQTATVNATFVDVVKESDSVLAFAGRLEAGHGRWGGFIDAGYSQVGIDGATGPGGVADIDIEYAQTIIDIGITYRLCGWGNARKEESTADASGRARATTLDLYAGGRLTNIDLTITPALAAERSGSESWLDPIVGLKLAAPLSDSWHIAANADIGGFGAASDLTWSGTLVAAYDFQLAGHPASLYAGYRAVGWDYTTSSGANKFTWNVVEHGITFGFTVQF
jgi:hypothetical protein